MGKWSVETLGLYLAVPFCKAKCSFCNFASDAFAPARMEGYLARICREMEQASAFATMHGLGLPQHVDTIYLGGGTPSLLPAEYVDVLLKNIRSSWSVAPDAEITVEAAPGQIADATLDAMLRNGVSRFSLGVQSFVDAESAAVGRLHTRLQCVAELERLRRRGVGNLGIDLICGLPKQTAESWRETLSIAIESGVDHISIYMLEVDEDSRLGREILRGGPRYRASMVPEDGAVADMYVEGCEMLARAGMLQYEISNFARTGMQSRHNRKYWERAPYLGLGLDAHSMLLTPGKQAVRFANADDFDAYMLGDAERCDVQRVSEEEAWEESIFLGLRLTEGVSLSALSAQFGEAPVQEFRERATLLVSDGLMLVNEDRVMLTAQGRVLSSSVFGELLAVGV